GIRTRMLWLIETGVDAAAHVLHEAAEDAAVDLTDDIRRVHDDARTRTAHRERPASRPRMKCRCRKTNSRIVGIVAKVHAAISCPHRSALLVLPCAPLTFEDSPASRMASVSWLWSLTATIGQTRPFSMSNRS